MSKPLIRWLLILVALAAATAGFGALLWAQDMRPLARVVLVVGQVALVAWLTRGLFVWRHVGWVSQASRLILLTLGLGLIALLCEQLGHRAAAIMFVGIWAMSAAFMLGVELLRFAFSPGHPVLGVARTLVDEAIRMRLALVFVVGVVLLIPFLPFALAGETRLQYRVESFLTYAMMLVTMLLSLMTLLLACRTVSSELTQHQAFLTLTKPVGRMQYLAGKWLGLMGLNLLLAAVAGVGIYAFTQVLVTDALAQVGADPDRQIDYIATQEQVLSARRSTEPEPVNESALALDFKNRLYNLRLKNPRRFGNPDDPSTQVTDRQRGLVRFEAVREWMTIPNRSAQTYRFSGLEGAAAVGPTVQLRFEPRAAGQLNDNMVGLTLRINDRPFADARTSMPLARVRNSTWHVAYIESQLIRDDGTLDVTIFNDAPGQPTVRFEPNGGLEVFYSVGGFGPNLIRSIAVVWVRLAFLAMLGLAAATFLSFPVACMVCLLVFLAAVGSSYLDKSLSNYAAVYAQTDGVWAYATAAVGKFFAKVREGELFDAFKLVIRLIGETFTLAVPPMARYSPTPLLAGGRMVEWSLVGGAAWRIGVISTGVVGLFAAWVFHRREIARVTV
ncbi:MAG: hypothetical protein V3V20_02535 [Algisphaera sp.]